MRALPGIEVEGLFTHFAAAEEGDSTFTRAQYDALMAASARLPWIPVRHCSASASMLIAPDMALDMVRAGLRIYGYQPAPESATDVELRRVLSLKSRVARVIDVEPGATVGLRPHVDRAAAIEDRADHVRLRRRLSARALEPRAACSCAAAARRSPGASRWTCAWPT